MKKLFADYRSRRRARASVLGLGAALLLAATGTANGAADIRSFGARGDGQHDESLAFEQAAAAGTGEVRVPAGRYRIAEVDVPDNTLVRGTGPDSVLLIPAGAAFGLRLGNGCTLTDLTFVAEPEPEAAAPTAAAPCVLIRDKRQISVRHCTFPGTPRTCIQVETARDLQISGCRFVDSGCAIDLTAVRDAIVSGNYIRNTAADGIRFRHPPGNESEPGTALIVVYNRLASCGGHGISGQGGRDIVLHGNILQSASGNGLDLDQCADVSIAGNTIRDGAIAIRVGEGCRGVSISGNTIRASEAANSEWIGIRLGSPADADDADDNEAGPVGISVTGNVIAAAGANVRTGIVIDGGRTVVCAANALQNAEILDAAGLLAASDAQDSPASAQIEILDLAPQWRFRPDPEDRGTDEGWFAPGLDDGAWELIVPEPVPEAAAAPAPRAAEAPPATTARPESGAGHDPETAAETGNAAASEATVETEEPASATDIGWFRCRLPEVPIPYPFVYLHVMDVPADTRFHLNGTLLVEPDRFRPSAVLDLSDRLVADTVSTLCVRLQQPNPRQGLRGPVAFLFSDTALAPEQVRRIFRERTEAPTAAPGPVPEQEN